MAKMTPKPNRRPKKIASSLKVDPQAEIAAKVQDLTATRSAQVLINGCILSRLNRLEKAMVGLIKRTIPEEPPDALRNAIRIPFYIVRPPVEC